MGIKHKIFEANSDLKKEVVLDPTKFEIVAEAKNTDILPVVRESAPKTPISIKIKKKIVRKPTVAM